MRITQKRIDRLLEILGNDVPRKIVILSHTNPDGDAIGSSIAWAQILRGMGHTVECVVPNKYPYFLDWMPRIGTVKIYKESPEAVKKLLAEADILFCMDFNQIGRLEGLSDAVLGEGSKAVKILIDHHLSPPKDFDLEFSHTTSCSTSFIVYNLIKKIRGLKYITPEIAELLYVGIMTDTGNFSYSFLTPQLFRAVAVLTEKGIDIPRINCLIYHSFTVDRVKLLGFALNKMQTVPAGKTNAAYITLTSAELRRFRFQPGDSEGFVNYPLTIKGLEISAIFIETRHFIRASFRSRGDMDVSLFANLYFEGGGHKNASGGKSYRSMDETVRHYKRSVEAYFREYYPHL